MTNDLSNINYNKNFSILNATSYDKPIINDDTKSSSLFGVGYIDSQIDDNTKIFLILDTSKTSIDDIEGKTLQEIYDTGIIKEVSIDKNNDGLYDYKCEIDKKEIKETIYDENDSQQYSEYKYNKKNDELKSAVEVKKSPETQHYIKNIDKNADGKIDKTEDETKKNNIIGNVIAAIALIGIGSSMISEDKEA